MYEAATKNLRTAERFLLEPALSGHFGTSVVSVCDISSKGARIKHGLPLEMGHKSALRLTVEGRPQPVSLEAVVVWTQLETGAKNRWVSGLRTYGSPESVHGVLTSLQDAGRTVRIEELRSSDRFTVTPALEASWNDAMVRIEDISARGARIESPVPLEASNLGVLRFVVPNANVTVEVAGTVAWASMKAVDPQLFRAGLLIAEKPELMRLAIGQLSEIGRAALDAQSLALKLKIIRARARQLAPSFGAIEDSGIPAEQYLLIHCVREELRMNPEEALHWYRRARLVIADPATRKIAPAIADHPDALAVWEYLDRTVDASVVGRAFALPR
jgi:PilZ domain